jgi:hypothetical protein
LGKEDKEDGRTSEVVKETFGMIKKARQAQL